MTKEYRLAYNNFKKAFGKVFGECSPTLCNTGSSRHISVVAGVKPEEQNNLTAPWNTFVGKGLAVQSEIGTIYFKYGPEKINVSYAPKGYMAYPIMVAVVTSLEYREEFLPIIGKALKASYHTNVDNDPLSVFDEKYDSEWEQYVSVLNPSDIVKIVSEYFSTFDYVVEHIKLTSKVGFGLNMKSNRETSQMSSELDPIIVHDRCYDFPNKIYGAPYASYFGEVVRLNGNNVMIDFDASKMTDMTLKYIKESVDLDQFKTLCEAKAV